jgi:hypothetical protein
LAEFAWQCLESTLRVTSNDEYNCDQLAARLTRLDPERPPLTERIRTSKLGRHCIASALA